jgi:hypothetical protein
MRVSGNQSLGRSAAWVEHLTGEDLAFIKRFLLASGSLKELAAQYGVSYPTVRRRLDRLIGKISALEDATVEDRFERLLHALFADGRIDETTLRSLIATYREESAR